MINKFFVKLGRDYLKNKMMTSIAKDFKLFKDLDTLTGKNYLNLKKIINNNLKKNYYRNY
jgi:hypothetical protein